MNTQINYHYYGDSVRNLFIFGGLIMLVSYPFFSSFIKAPIAFSIIGCIALVVFAGLRTACSILLGQPNSFFTFLFRRISCR